MSFDLQLIDNDLKIGKDGKIKVVTDTVKLHQDILKIILTPIGSMIDHPWYGCYIDDNVVGKNLPEHILVAEIQNSILESLNRLQKLQISQSATQKVSLSEIIGVISGVDVQRNAADGRQLNIVVTVLSKRMDKVEELFTIIS